MIPKSASSGDVLEENVIMVSRF